MRLLKVIWIESQGHDGYKVKRLGISTIGIDDSQDRILFGRIASPA